MTKSVLVPAGGNSWAKVAIDQYAWQPAEAWRPTTTVALAHDDSGVHVRFEVDDAFVIARTADYGAPVYEDSCVEFFFQPGPQPHYFNIEVNAAGGVIFHRQLARGIERTDLGLEVARELNVRVEPGNLILAEHEGPLSWTVNYVIPWALIERFAELDRSAWRGNLYKCAEANSHPHFGSWSRIETSEPDFHRPEFFGLIEFEPKA